MRIWPRRIARSAFCSRRPTTCAGSSRISAGHRTAAELFAGAHDGGVFALTQGRRKEAIAESNIALELDPVSLHTLADNAAIHAYAGDLAVARELMDRARDLHCPPGVAEAPWMYVYGLIDQLEGRFDAAIDLLERCTRTNIMHTVPLAILGYCYARTGRRDRAGEVLDRLAGLSTHRHAIHFSRAAILAGLDDTNGALDDLERGYEEKNPWLFLLNVAPWFEAIRSHPRYRALIARMML